MGGDTAKYALDNKLVDELATSTEVEKALTKQFGWSKADNNYRAISYYDYNVKTPSDQGFRHRGNLRQRRHHGR